MNQTIRFPKSSFFEFYCNEHRLTLSEYRNEKSNQKLDELAEYYDDVTYDIVNQIFIVEKNRKLNFVYEAELEFPPVLYDFCHLYPGFAVVRKGNMAGNLFFHEGLSEPSSYRTVNVFEMKRGNCFGVETASGKTLLDCNYRFVKVYPDFILTISDEGFLLFHPDGRQIFEKCFEEVDLTTMHRDYLYVQKDGQWGLVHVRGHWIVPALYRNRTKIEIWDDDYFACSQDGKKGLYNRQGKLIIPFEYDKIDPLIFYWNLFMVTQNEKVGLIDHLGTIIFPCIYDKITFLHRNCCRISQEGENNIWIIPDIPDLTEFTKLNTPYQLVESSCHDFFKMSWLCKEIGDVYAGMNCNLVSDGVDYKETIRWFLMYSILNNDLCNQYYKKISGKYKALSSPKSAELLSLFQLKVFRSGENEQEGYYFSSSYKLAGIYFEGTEVITNYRYAFEVYTYCIENRYMDDTNRHTATFETICDELINSISQDKPVNVFDDCWSDEYRQCALIAHRLGWMLYTGNGVEKDETMGMKLLNAAQSIGYIENQNVILYPSSEENDDEVCPF